MEVKVSSIVKETVEHPTRFSASAWETGNQSIGQETWKNSCDQDVFKLTAEQDVAWRDHLPEYGAWNEEEIAAMTAEESTGLFIQFVSGDYRELSTLANDAGYDIDSLTDSQYEDLIRLAGVFGEAQSCGGTLYPNNGAWYYYIGI